MEDEQIITEYNESKDEPPILADFDDEQGGEPKEDNKDKNENFLQEEKIYQNSNVRVTISEVKGNEQIQNDFI